MINRYAEDKQANYLRWLRAWLARRLNENDLCISATAVAVGLNRSNFKRLLRTAGLVIESEFNKYGQQGKRHGTK